MIASAASSGTRTASPSAIVSAELVLIGLPAATDKRIGRGVGGDDADDLGGLPQRLARRDHRADAAAEPDRHVDGIEARDGAEQFEAAARDAAHERGIERAHEVEPVGGGARGGVFIGRLEIVALLDEGRAEGLHRPVLLDAVAVRHDDRRGKPEARGGIGDRSARDCRGSR